MSPVVHPPALLKLKIYIAAPSTERERAGKLQDLIEHNPEFEVTARWIKLESFEKKDRDPIYLAEWAVKDLADVSKSDLFVLLNDEAYRDKGSGGRHTETGYAIFANIPIVIVGERTNIFHWLPEVKLVKDDAELLKVIYDIYHEAYR